GGRIREEDLQRRVVVLAVNGGLVAFGIEAGIRTGKHGGVAAAAAIGEQVGHHHAAVILAGELGAVGEGGAGVEQAQADALPAEAARVGVVGIDQDRKSTR